MKIERDDKREEAKHPFGVTRRGFLQAAAAAGAATSCASLWPGVAGAQQARQGGTLRMAIIADPVLNPILTMGIQSTTICKVLYSGLCRPDPVTLEPRPDLAKSWQVSRDGLTWTFTLRDDVKWHDGKPFTAEDVKWTLEERATAKGAWRGPRVLKTVEVVEPHAVRFHLTQPFAPLAVLMGFTQYIGPKHLLQGKDQAEFAEFNKKNPIGTGPFKMKEFVTGQHVTLTANPDYFLGRPYLDTFVFKVIPDVNVQVAQLKTGELDFALIEPQNIAAVKGVPDLKLDVVDYVNHYYIAFQIKNPLFADPRVRLAMIYAVDRQTMVEKVLLGYGTVATGTISPALGWAYNPNLKPLPYDPQKAQALLAEVGWKAGPGGILTKDGKPFKFTLSVDKGNPAREQAATIAQQFYKKLGMDVTLETMEWAAFASKRWLGREYDAMYMWWITSPDPDQLDYYGTGGANNHSSYSNPEVDKVLLEAQQITDRERRRQLYYRFQELEMSDPPLATLYSPKEIRVTNAKLVIPPVGYRDALTHSEAWHFTA
jgi:peptide/nickel transport system substrate-binding protein